MNWSTKKVLVTGAGGFIGSHLVEELVRRGSTVRALVHYNSLGRWGWLEDVPAETLARVDVRAGDIRDPSGVVDACAGIEIVFHLAALVGIPFSYRSPDSYVDTNINGTLNVLQAARTLNLEKVVHTSSSEVYGSAQYAPMDERHPINPQSPYAATKVAADSLASSFCRSFDLPVAIVRPFNTFGPRQSARAIIPTIISQAYDGDGRVRLGNLTATRDFNYVADTVEALMSVAQSPSTSGEVFNVGSGRETSIADLVAMIGRLTGKQLRVETQASRVRPAKSEVERLICDAGKLRALSGCVSRVSLEEGLDKTCRWIKAHPHRFKTGIYGV